MHYSKKEISVIEEAKKFSDLPNAISDKNSLEGLVDLDIPNPIKENVEHEELQHRIFNSNEFWRKVPAFNDVTREQFSQFKFQNRFTVRSVARLEEYTKGLVDPGFIKDVKKGMEKAPMNLSISPYLLSLINWDDPYNDPLRIQFIPIDSGFLNDHPMLTLDSLGEQEDSPVPGLVHRYFDKALFLPLDVCPVYCRFCTRSYAIGGDTEIVEKERFKNAPDNWNRAFAYIASRPEIEDIVISGGDAYMLVPERLKLIGEMLLDIPHVRRIRYASKGPAVMPMRITNDKKWTNALIDVVNLGREKGKEVVLHTHFNSANEITFFTKESMDYLFKKGVTVRNQSVLIKGVNDTPDKMIHLIRKLSYMNVQPYYVYQHDMVPGAEDMRTSVKDTVELEKRVRGVTAGFNTPLFVTDAPGGGGKRDVHSYDFYDQVTGISVYRSPSVDDSKIYLYFDPISSLPSEGQKLWEDASLHDDLIQNALKASGYKSLTPVI
jgi:lysine 2,3-aminomutase